MPIVELPKKDGWYVVKLKPGLFKQKPYDVDYCQGLPPSDGGGRDWLIWHPENIEAWSEIDTYF